MELRQLELFLAVMEEVSVTKAAARVHLSPGAVSLQLRSLAEELRTDLFIKSGKRLLPTPSAERLAERARILLRQAREIEQEFANDPATDTQPFCFATGATALIHRLGRPLRLLRKHRPQIAMQVTVSATEEMVRGLHDHRFDLALISLPYDETNLNILPLFDEELLIIRPSPKRVRGWHVGAIQIKDLQNAPFLLYSQRSNMRTLIEKFLDELGVKPRVIMEADDTEAIKRLVESGFGLSILPEFALRTQPRMFQAFRVPGRRLVRHQALAMAKTDYPRALTLDVARFLQSVMSEA